MFNFMNIDEIEFEEICKQILEKKTNQSFRVFGRGRDGGIDIQSNINAKIIGQAKFYLHTSQSTTISKIKQEFARIKGKDIEQYYLFIGREMSPQSIQEIYEELHFFIKKKENIFTLKEINELLSRKEYGDIVEQHIKLWLCSTNILEETNNKEKFLDCEILLDNIKEEVNMFVQTELYEKCKELLEEQRTLLILGAPGIGKTIISKMLVLNYAQKGYCIRYTNNINLEELKQTLASNPDKKELIFLDDCLGQRYLELHEKRENDIINLIKYIKRQPNKMILLNSRITIFQEAQRKQYEIGKCIENQNLQIQVINIENISDVEKARILHQHLVLKKLPEQYMEEIIKNYNYLKIIKHPSYSPRIIDYMTQKSQYEKIQPQLYVDAIQKAFEGSFFVWKDEFENRIEIEDRIFLTTLFSISDYGVKENVLKRAFYERLKKENIDTTIPIYETVLKRLNQSFIKIGIQENVRIISVINPSVNDFLKAEIEKNVLEIENILEASISIEPFQRLIQEQSRYDEIIKEKINKKAFLKLITNSGETIEELYLAHIAYYNMIDDVQIYNLRNIICSLKYGYDIFTDYIDKNEIIIRIMESKLYENENLKEFFSDGKILSKILHGQLLEYQIELLQYIYRDDNQINMNNEEEIITYIEAEFKKEVRHYDIDEVALDINFDDVVANEIEELKSEYTEDEKWNEVTEEGVKKELVERLRPIFKDTCIDYIQQNLYRLHCELPDTLYEKVEWVEVENNLDNDEINLVTLKYINLVYNTYEEDYRYYKKYIYDGHLLNHKTEEEREIHSIFKQNIKYLE